MNAIHLADPLPLQFPGEDSGRHVDNNVDNQQPTTWTTNQQPTTNIRGGGDNDNDKDNNSFCCLHAREMDTGQKILRVVFGTVQFTRKDVVWSQVFGHAHSSETDVGRL